MMRTKVVSSRILKNILLYGLAYLLCLVNLVVCVAVIIQLRTTVNALWLLSGGDHYSRSLINQLSVFLSGLAAFVYVVYLESYYRDCVAEVINPKETGDASARAAPPSPSRLRQWMTDPRFRILLRRSAITTAIPLSLFVVFFILHEIAWCVMR